MLLDTLTAPVIKNTCTSQTRALSVPTHENGELLPSRSHLNNFFPHTFNFVPTKNTTHMTPVLGSASHMPLFAVLAVALPSLLFRSPGVGTITRRRASEHLFRCSRAKLADFLIHLFSFLLKSRRQVCG